MFRLLRASLWLALTCLCLPIHSQEPDINLDGTPAKAARRSWILELGSEYSIGGNLGWQPQLGGYLDLPSSWQSGLHARIVTMDASGWYDIFPQVSFELRKLWLGDEGADPIRNSEYFEMSVGGFLAYGFNGEKVGVRPLGALALGKYWMPFDNQPFGMDISLELSRCFSGHLPGHSDLVFITTGLALFYVLP